MLLCYNVNIGGIKMEVMKKILFLIIGILIGVFYTIIVDMMFNNNSNDDTKENNKGEENGVSYHEFQVCTYDEAYESDGYVFFNDTVVYECQSTGEFGCYLTIIDDFSYCNKTDSVVMITDNQRDFLYN